MPERQGNGKLFVVALFSIFLDNSQWVLALVGNIGKHLVAERYLNSSATWHTPIPFCRDKVKCQGMPNHK